MNENIEICQLKNTLQKTNEESLITTKPNDTIGEIGPKCEENGLIDTGMRKTGRKVMIRLKTKPEKISYFNAEKVGVDKIGDDEVFVLPEEDERIAISNYGRMFRLNNYKRVTYPIKLISHKYLTSELIYKYFLEHKPDDRFLNYIDGNTKNNNYKNLETLKFRKGASNLQGLRFGRYLVIKEDTENKDQNRSKWICRCDCGNERSVLSFTLKNGASVSCGCFNREISKIKNTGEKNPLWKGYKEIRGDFWRGYKIKAEQRNLLFEITMEQAWDLFIKQNRKCKLSGVPIQFQTSYKVSDGTASLDRIDSTKGYTIDNIQWIHKKLNKAKWNMPNQEFIEWCKLVAKNNE